MIKIIELLLAENKISNSAVTKLLGVTFHTANKYMEKLEYYNLIPLLNDKRGARKINPVENIKIDDLMGFLKDYYSDEQITEAIEKIPKNT